MNTFILDAFFTSKAISSDNFKLTEENSFAGRKTNILNIGLLISNVSTSYSLWELNFQV